MVLVRIYTCMHSHRGTHTRARWASVHVHTRTHAHMHAHTYMHAYRSKCGEFNIFWSDFVVDLLLSSFSPASTTEWLLCAAWENMFCTRVYMCACKVFAGAVWGERTHFILAVFWNNCALVSFLRLHLSVARTPALSPDSAPANPQHSHTNTHMRTNIHIEAGVANRICALTSQCTSKHSPVAKTHTHTRTYRSMRGKYICVKETARTHTHTYTHMYRSRRGKCICVKTQLAHTHTYE